jgi:hypothetical protein
MASIVMPIIIGALLSYARIGALFMCRRRARCLAVGAAETKGRTLEEIAI